MGSHKTRETALPNAKAQKQEMTPSKCLKEKLEKKGKERWRWCTSFLYYEKKRKRDDEGTLKF